MYNQLDIFGGKGPEQPAKKAETKLERNPLGSPVPPIVVEEKIPNVTSSLNIPADKELDSKQYYPISEVANMFNVNISLLRFWEKEFSILKPRKNKTIPCREFVW